MNPLFRCLGRDVDNECWPVYSTIMKASGIYETTLPALISCVVIVALGLSASVIVRSIRTANTNRQLTSLLTFEEGTAPEAEAAAPALENTIPFINGAGTTAAAASADALKLSYINVKSGDALLTLCTCVGNDRLIVAARRIRPNESKATLQTLY